MISDTLRQFGLVAKVLALQTGLAVALAAVYWGMDGPVAAWSALLGGLAAVLPNGFLALRLKLPRRDRGPGALLRAAYVGELGKLALTVLMLMIVFTGVKPLAAGALIAGFVAAQLATMAGLLMQDNVRITESSNDNGE